jgi:uncharacterized protein (TIGR02453 family)
MAPEIMFDLLDYPPFTGFPREGIRFFKQLKKNNNREWFNRHKPDYEQFVKVPMQSLIAALQPGFESFAPEFDLNPKHSIFRIYRDVRFSSDKSPYKTHAAAHFVIPGRPKGLEGSGYYLHIEPGEVFMGAGIYIPSSDQLKKIRRGIVDRSAEFLAVISDRGFRKRFGPLTGEVLKRVPKGFESDNPMAEYLKLKQFFVGSTFDDPVCGNEQFIKLCLETYRAAAPLVEFLNTTLGA